MKGNFKETESLGTLFGAIADVLEQREEMLLERIAMLEEKIGQLEERIASLEENALYFEETGDEDEVEVEICREEDNVVGEENIVGEENVVEEDVAAEEEVESAGAEEVEYVEPELVEAEETAHADELPEVELEFEFELDDEEFEDKEDDDDSVLVLDKVRPDWYDWEVDIPGHYIDDIREGIGLNDKILFMRELFGGSVEVFNEAIDDLNGMHNLVETVEYLRDRFPHWDEESDEVYRFYMIVRRRFNKQK